MSTATDSSSQRAIDTWFAHYSGDHRNATNQKIHVICVPAILWSVIALLWCIPAPGSFRPGIWAGLAMVVTALFYYRASRRLGLGMVVVFVLMALSCRVIFDFYFAEGTDPAFAEESIRVAHQVQLEDGDICERVQRNLHSRSYTTGRFSVKRENGGYHFHRMLAKALQKPD